MCEKGEGRERERRIEGGSERGGGGKREMYVYLNLFTWSDSCSL